MEDNQRPNSKSNKRKKKKSGGLGEKSEKQNHVEPQFEKQLPSQLQQSKPQKQPAVQTQHQSKQHHQPKPQKQPLAEKQPQSHPEQPKLQKQTKSPKPEQKPKKQPKPPKQSQSETFTQPQAPTQSAPAKQSLKNKQQEITHAQAVTQPQPVTQPAPAKQSQKKKQQEITHPQSVTQPQTATQPQTITQTQPVTQPAPAKESPKQKPQTVTQPQIVTKPQTGTQLQAVTQPQSVAQLAPAKQSLKKKQQEITHPQTVRQPQPGTQPQAVSKPQPAPAKESPKQKPQTVTQPQAITRPQTVTQPQAVSQPPSSKQSLQKQPSVEKQAFPDKQLRSRPVSESNSQSSERCQFSNSKSKTENSADEGKTSRSPEQEYVREAIVIGSKCVPSGDTPSCEVTASALSAEGSDVPDASCARNASVSIASTVPTVQIAKMTGPTEVKTEGRPAINKTREEIEAERKLRKAAKQAKKGKKPDGEPKDVEKVVEGVKQIKVDEKVEIPKESKNSQPKVEVKKPAEGETTEKQPAEGGKSKAELRAERRAIQEAQRAAKAASKDAKVLKEKQQQQQSVKIVAEKPQAAAPERIPCKTKTPSDAKSTERRVKLFSHLYQCSFNSISQSLKVNNPQYHPAIVRLGVQYSERVVLGSNARCVALLHALKQVIADYETPPQKEFARGLEAYLQPNVEFLQQCRPLAVSMTNALRHVKRQLTALPNNVKDSQANQKLQDSIDTYIKDQIETAAEAIGITAEEKIADGDVILVYACSSLVLHALKMTHAKGKKFSVVVVDSLPWLEGREMLRRLVSVGIKCTYVHISAASFIMREVTKVLLGAHALLTNGYVMSRAGSSQIALLAHSCNVPVLVCCETHKFSERVQMDSFVYNELGNPDELVGKRRNGEGSENRTFPLESWRDLPYLTLLNLVYDVTPPDLVTAVVTELAILPCTSVPVILRIKPTDC